MIRTFFVVERYKELSIMSTSFYRNLGSQEKIAVKAVPFCDRKHCTYKREKGKKRGCFIGLEPSSGRRQWGF
jgi:hypothetical protein